MAATRGASTPKQTFPWAPGSIPDSGPDSGPDPDITAAPGPWCAPKAGFIPTEEVSHVHAAPKGEVTTNRFPHRVVVKDGGRSCGGRVANGNPFVGCPGPMVHPKKLPVDG